MHNEAGIIICFFFLQLHLMTAEFYIKKDVEKRINKYIIYIMLFIQHYVQKISNIFSK